MQQFIKPLPNRSRKPFPPDFRIADILLLPDEEEEDGGEQTRIRDMNGFRGHRHAEVTCGYECASPLWIASRLIRRMKDRRRPVHWREEYDVKSVDGQSASLSCPALDVKDGGGNGGPSGGITEGAESGSCGKGNMLNLGVACSLLYLLALAKEELCKMKELRTNMEMLLNNIEENRTRDPVNKKLRLKESPAVSPSASCLTDLKGVSSCSRLHSCQSPTASYLLQGEDSISLSSCSTVESRKEPVEGMEQLEAELEAELERLQLQLDTESFPKSMKIAGHDSSTRSSSNLSLGEVIDLNEAPIQVHSGVPPIELERKLHELLESRQQERIKELEAALECTRQKLSEKEREAMWWKATALHMSHHAPESPRLS